MKEGRIVSCLLLFLTWASPAMSAPFCVEVRGTAPECVYHDATQCRRRAMEQRAVCVGNPQELMLTPGVGKYCMVESTRLSQCIYADRGTCETDAARHGAVCVDSTPRAVQPDPFRSDPNLRY